VLTRLLIVTSAVSLVMSTLVALLFFRPISRILGRVVAEELAPSWRRYILFATYVVGIGGGVRLWEIERYVTPDKDGTLLQLTSNRWIIEVCKSVIGSLQSIAWMLLVFFLFALVAYVVERGFESRKATAKGEAVEVVQLR
jgi:hypothetical protein